MKSTRQTAAFVFLIGLSIAACATAGEGGASPQPTVDVGPIKGPHIALAAFQQPSSIDQAFLDLAAGKRINDELFVEALAAFNKRLANKRTDTPAVKKLLARLADVKSPIVGPDRSQRLTLAKDQLVTLRMVRDSHLAATLPAESMHKHPSADAFPGPVPDDAPRVSKTLQVNVKAYGWVSTGLYAPPGEKIRVTIPADLVDAGWKLRIGPQTAVLSLSNHKVFKRFHRVDRVYDLTAPSTICVSAFGGLICVVLPVPDESGLSLNKGDIYGLVDSYTPPVPEHKPVGIEGAVQAPLYIHGQTDPGRWRDEIRAYPAPWAEIGSDRVIFSLPSEFIRDLDDPDRVMEVWDRILDSMAELCGRPTERPIPTRFALDAHVNWGAAYAGYPIVAPFGWAQPITDAVAGWGHVHELGHLHQHRTWTFQGTGEVTVNLFSLYSLETVYNDRTQRRDPDRLAGLTRTWMAKPKAERNWMSAGGPWDKLTPYIILVEEFGWDPLKKVFRDYRLLPVADHPQSEQDRAGDFMLRLSREVGRNLAPFFDVWGVQLSPGYVKEAAALPDWESSVMKQLIERPEPQPEK